MPSSDAVRIRPAALAAVPAIKAIYTEQVLHGTATWEYEPLDDAEMASRSGGMLFLPLVTARTKRSLSSDANVRRSKAPCGSTMRAPWQGAQLRATMSARGGFARAETSAGRPWPRSGSAGFPTWRPNTYAAHPVACAAALAEAMGARLLDGLHRAVGRSPIVGEVRGRGLMACVKFVVRLAPPLCISPGRDRSARRHRGRQHRRPREVDSRTGC